MGRQGSVPRGGGVELAVDEGMECLENSELRKMEGDNIERFLDGETEYEIYEMGLYPH